MRQGDKVAQMTLELHLNTLVQPVSELQDTERGSGGFGSTDTPKGKVPPSPGRPQPPSQEEGAQISRVSSSTLTLLSPSRAQEYVLKPLMAVVWLFYGLIYICIIKYGV